MNHACLLGPLTLAVLAPARPRDAEARPRTLQGHHGSVLAVAFSPDGQTPASGSGGPESLIRLWPVARLAK